MLNSLTCGPDRVTREALKQVQSDASNVRGREGALVLLLFGVPCPACSSRFASCTQATRRAI